MRNLCLIALFGAALLATGPVGAAEPVAIRIGYLGQEQRRPPALSNLDELPDDEGLAGARLGVADNNTTGRFTGQEFELVDRRIGVEDDPGAALTELVEQGLRSIVLNLDAAALDLALAAPAAGMDGILLFNAGAADNRFRDADCRRNLLHTRPSRSMLTDSLAQYLVKKRWTRLFLVQGPRPEDGLYADALRRSAKKFGLSIVVEKTWTGEHDARRSAPAEVPLFTQVGDYDVLVVADEIGDFGDYVMYRTWTPRPVAGTQGLTAAAWGRPVEQWGATQLQERFRKTSGRWMLPGDFAAWVAARSVGEAATRTGSGKPEAIAARIRSEGFELAAFMGRKLSYRSWNGQLRQPIPLMTARSVVAQAPLPGFLHQRTELDSLGLDQPESKCAR